MECATYRKWRSDMESRPRGRQCWESRVRFYEAVAGRPGLATGDVATLAETAGSASSTFYASFGPKAPDRLLELDPLPLLLVETKAWAVQPYLEGYAEAVHRLRPDPHTRLESLVRIWVEWVYAHPGLAGAGERQPPVQVIAELRAAVPEVMTQDAEVALVGLVDQLTEEALSHPDRGSLNALNSVRPIVATLVGAPSGPSAQRMAINVIEAVSDYAEFLISPEGGGPLHLSPEVQQALDGLLALRADS